MCRFFHLGTCFTGSLLPWGFQLQTGFSKRQQPGCQAGDNKKGICPDPGDSAICASVSCRKFRAHSLIHSEMAADLTSA